MTRLGRIGPVVLCVLCLACGSEDGSEQGAAGETEAAAAVPTWDTVQDPSDRLVIVSGFSGPEAVRYDPDQDVYFVSNFNGDGMDRDGNGFVSRVGPDGVIESLSFMTGSEESPLHAPRGMHITGDTLWVADVDGVHGFRRTDGGQVAFVDFTAFAPGFLNDIAVGPDGALYVTDTVEPRVYRVEGREVTVAVDGPELGRPNGIAWDGAGERFLLAPWGGEQEFRAWQPDGGIEVVATSPGGDFDGIEVLGSRWLVASQADSSLHVIEEGAGRVLIRVGGQPADIGVDTRRSRVAVPYISLNRVDVWRLPPG
jgi:DNA-binding beta-propeller fold protein YncE